MLGHAQNPRSPDNDSNPVFSLELGRKSTTSFISRSVTPRRGIMSWLAANRATSIYAAGAGAVLYRMRDVTTLYIPCRFVIKSRACHVTFRSVCTGLDTIVRT